jgi:hypothetical protein
MQTMHCPHRRQSWAQSIRLYPSHRVQNNLCEFVETRCRCTCICYRPGSSREREEETGVRSSGWKKKQKQLKAVAEAVYPGPEPPVGVSRKTYLEKVKEDEDIVTTMFRRL